MTPRPPSRMSPRIMKHSSTVGWISARDSIHSGTTAASQVSSPVDGSTRSRLLTIPGGMSTCLPDGRYRIVEVSTNSVGPSPSPGGSTITSTTTSSSAASDAAWIEGA